MATITLEDVKKAKSYMPVETKDAVARLMSKLCVLTQQTEAEESGLPLPPMKVENRVRKLQCLHGVLAGWYFGGDFEKEKLRYRDKDGKMQEREASFCMSEEVLDGWLEDHPMNQLERLKKEKTVANKVYDILYDFKAFELMLNGAIREEIEVANDPAVRMAQAILLQSSPDSMRETLKVIREFQEEKARVSENA